MLKVYNNNIIEFNRGDSFTLTLSINEGTKIDPLYYSLSDTDEVYFGIMEPNKRFEECIVKKCLTKKDVNKDNEIEIKFTPEDTLNILSGQYYYEVKLFRKDNNLVDTVIGMTKLFIVE